MLMVDKAIEKLTNGLAEAKKAGQKEMVMAEPIAETLIKFSKEDGEFAQAVVQGGSLADCVKFVAKKAGTSISDIKAFTLAVQFYFPGAKIKVQMQIDLIGHAAQTVDVKPEEPAKGISINLMDFL